MSKPTAISNTSPLVIFAKCGKIDLLLKAFQKPLTIEEAVYHEAVTQGIAKRERDAEIIRSYVEKKAIVVKKASNFIDTPFLDLGERATISLAREQAPNFVLMDDLQGRRSAEQLELKVVGCIGILSILLKLKLIGKKESIDTLNEMIKTGYRINAKLLEEFKKTVKENKNFLP